MIDHETVTVNHANTVLPRDIEDNGNIEYISERISLDPTCTTTKAASGNPKTIPL